jgi:hypothetical protein
MGDWKKKRTMRKIHNIYQETTPELQQGSPDKRALSPYIFSHFHAAHPICFSPLYQEWDGKPAMHSANRTHEPEPYLSPRVRESLRDLNEDITSCNCHKEAQNTRKITDECGGTVPGRQQSCPAQEHSCRFKLLHA